MGFLDDFNNQLNKLGIEAGTGAPPRYWTSTGNYVLNKIISGSFYRGYPQGRVTGLAGPSGSGKSFLIANAIREAQSEGIITAAIDSENALDSDFIRNVGANPDSSVYAHVPVDTIGDCKKSVSKIVETFRKAYGTDPKAPKLFIVIDSLDMLLTDSEEKSYIEGKVTGDMGQRSKQLKSMLRSFVHAIRELNISMIVTHQVYKNQDLKNGEGLWIISDAIKYSLSQVFLLQKLKLRTEKATGKDAIGIRMKCEGYKTRFTKPFQTVTIEVPYDTGMDPYNGLVEVAEEIGVIKQAGSWYSFDDGEESLRFQGKGKFNEIPREKVLAACEKERTKFLDGMISDDQIDLTPQQSAKKKRIAKKAT